MVVTAYKNSDNFYKISLKTCRCIPCHAFSANFHPFYSICCMGHKTHVSNFLVQLQLFTNDMQKVPFKQAATGNMEIISKSASKTYL
jgi:hypothetical protein